MKPSALLLMLIAIVFCCAPPKADKIVDKDALIKKAEGSFTLVNEKGDTLPSGVPVLANGKNIDTDSLPESDNPPFFLPPKKVAAKERVDLAQTLFAVSVPSNLPVLTPGKGGLPFPKRKRVRSRKVLARQPEPLEALPLRRDDKANYDVQFLDVEQGVPSSTIYEILEDERGMIWFGTMGTGLSCYDGHWMSNYTTDEGLADNYVFRIIQDQQGDLWFGTAEGITHYDGRYFYHFPISEFESGFFTVNDMLIDKNGIIWISTRSQGLLRFEPDGDNYGVFTYFTTSQGLLSNTVRRLFEDSHGRLWICAYEGVVRYHPSADINQMGSFVQYVSRYSTGYSNADLNESIMGENIHAIAEDKQGHIWFGARSRLIRLDTENGQERISFLTNRDSFKQTFISGIHTGKHGHLWISTYGGQLFAFDGQHFTLYIDGGAPAWAWIEDSAGNLWMGTDGKGLMRFRERSFIHYNADDGLIHQNITSIAEDRKGDLWFRTWGGGVCQYLEGPEKSKGGVYNYFESTHRNYAFGDYIIEDSKGRLWIGGNSATGVSFYDGSAFTTFPKYKGLPTGVIDIVEDQQGNLWFGTTTEGLSVLNRSHPDKPQIQRFTQFSIENGLPSSYAQPTLVDREGKIWILNWQAGVSYYKPGSDHLLSDGTFTHLTTNEGLSNNNVSCMLEDRKGNLWFGTDGSGISHYSPENGFTHFTIKEGLSNEFIKSMVEDRQGNIWVSTNHGISLLVPKSAEPMSNITSVEEAYKCLTFGKEDGLKGLDFNSAICLDHQNRIWWGSDEGATMLDLNEFTLPADPPKGVKLKYLEIDQAFVDFNGLSDTSYRNTFSFGQELDLSSDSVIAFCNYPAELKLPYHLNHLTFYFSAIDWGAPHKIKFSYRIIGMDENWSPAQTEPKADYRNLPSGNLILQVKAMGAAQVWSDPFEYRFTILPPWYRTRWAYVLWTILFISVLYGMYSYQLKRQLALAEARRLKELDQVKSRLYTNITHEFRTPLTIILGMAEQMKKDPQNWFNEGLRLIRRNGKQLLNLINQMLDLSKLESGYMPLKLVHADVISYLQYISESFHSYADSKDVRLHFMTDQDEIHMDYDPEKLENVLSNLLSNAIKFTPAGGNVYIDLRIAASGGESLQIQVRDDGIGIEPEFLPFVFDRFYQGDDSNTRRGEGTGVGLALVKELVNTMSGNIIVESSRGRGTRFIILLPITNTASEVQPERMPDRHQLISDIVLPIPEKKSAPADISQSDRHLILLIEDNKDVLTYLTSFLSGSYQIITANNGQQGMEMAFEHIPDLVVSDVMMPEKDGYEVCRALKTDERTSHIPIILLTAKSDQAFKIEGLATGADAYLSKPFNQEELLVRIDKLIELRRQMQIHFQQSGVLSKTLNAPVKTKEDTFLHKTLGIIEKNMGDENFGMPQLCKELHLSRSHVFRKLKAVTGKSATHLIRSFRLEKAKELLDDSPMNITEICFEVGFNNPQYFSKIFQEEFGMPPSTYRKR